MNKKGQNGNLIWILILIAFAFFVFKGQLFATFSNEDYRLRNPDLRWIYPRDYGLSDSGTIKLPLGVNLSNIQSVSVELKGCSLDSEAQAIISTSLQDFTFKFTNCDFLTYADGGEPYIHYQTQSQSLNLPFGLDSNEIEYIFSEGNNKIISKRIVLNEWVGCISNSQCPQEIRKPDGEITGLFCDQVYHQCSLKENIDGQEKIVYVDRYISENPDAEIKSQGFQYWWLVILIAGGIITFLIFSKKQ